MKKRIAEKIYTKLLALADEAGDDCVITGGHYMARGDDDPDLNLGTVTSFDVAAHIYGERIKTHANIGLGLLVNNIGTTCDQNVCVIREPLDDDAYEFPASYRTILDGCVDHKVDLIVYWEKHLRNRGKKEFIRRVRKDPGITEEADGWWFRDGKQSYLLTRKSPKDKYGTPACPLIMAALAMEQEKQGYRSSLNFYYIGPDNYLNIPNHFMIEKGAAVAKAFGAAIDVKNVYFTEEKVITNF